MQGACTTHEKYLQNRCKLDPKHMQTSYLHAECMQNIMRSTCTVHEKYMQSPIWQAFWHIFWHCFWHISWHSFWHSFWHIFWHIFWHSSWYSFGSGGKHSAGILAVRARWRTPGADHRSSGPVAKNTRRASLRFGSGGEPNTLQESSRVFGPGGEHLAPTIAIGVSPILIAIVSSYIWSPVCCCEDHGGRRRRRRWRCSKIKPNKPHLTGGESPTRKPSGLGEIFHGSILDRFRGDFLQKRRVNLRFFPSQTLNVWYIYLHLPQKSNLNLGNICHTLSIRACELAQMNSGWFIFCSQLLPALT